MSRYVNDRLSLCSDRELLCSLGIGKGQQDADGWSRALRTPLSGRIWRNVAAAHDALGNPLSDDAVIGSNESGIT